MLTRPALACIQPSGTTGWTPHGGVLHTAGGCCGDVAEKIWGPFGTHFPLAGACRGDIILLRKSASN